MRRPSFFHVKKRTLLAIAGCVWIIAGFNVARLGSTFVCEKNIAFFNHTYFVVCSCFCSFRIDVF